MTSFPTNINSLLKRLPFSGTSLSYWDVFLLYISINSLMAILMLAAHLFYPLISVLISILTTAALLLTLHIQITKEAAFDKYLVMILILALVFRLPPYLYLMGGQDQGTYVNMSKQYEISHSLYAVDYYRKTLDKDEQKLYDKHGNYIMPSIEKWNRPDSEYSMVFYPLHPAWMSIFSQLLGSDNRVYSLTMFSLISIVSFYLLCYEISGKRRVAGYISALFLALNPMHVFFSKFTVGEMVALAFTSSSFYFLVKYYNLSGKGTLKPFYLILSALLMNGFFYTRMSSFLYIPFFYLMAMSIILFIQTGKVKKQLLFYLFGLLLLFAASYRYYYLFLRNLFDLIYNSSVLRFSRHYLSFMGNYVEQNLLFFLLFLVILLFVTIILNKNRRLVGVLHKSTILLPVLFNVVFLLLLVLTYNNLLNYGYVASDPDIRHNVRGQGFLSVKHLALYVIALYTGLLAFISFPLANIYLQAKKITGNAAFTFLEIFILLFLTINVVQLPIIRYQFYNARYYFSESVPYLLLFAAVFLSLIWNRKLSGVFAKITAALTLLYFLVFSSVQFFGSEGAQPEFYTQITNTVQRNDLLLTLTQSPETKYDYNFMLYVLGPLKYYYGYDMFVLNKADQLPKNELSNQSGKHKNTYLLSNQKLAGNPNFVDEKLIRLHYNHYNVSPGCTEHTYEFLPIESIKEVKLPGPIKCLTPPNTYYIRYRDFYLYKLKVS